MYSKIGSLYFIQTIDFVMIILQSIMIIQSKFQEEELNNNGGYHRMRSRGCSTKTGTRTGWPQHVWALELKQ